MRRPRAGSWLTAQAADPAAARAGGSLAGHQDEVDGEPRRHGGACGEGGRGRNDGRPRGQGRASRQRGPTTGQVRRGDDGVWTNYGDGNILHAGIGAAQTSIYTVMSRVYHPAQLQPWDDLTGEIRADPFGEKREGVFPAFTWTGKGSYELSTRLTAGQITFREESSEPAESDPAGRQAQLTASDVFEAELVSNPAPPRRRVRCRSAASVRVAPAPRCQ